MRWSRNDGGPCGKKSSSALRANCDLTFGSVRRANERFSGTCDPHSTMGIAETYSPSASLELRQQRPALAGPVAATVSVPEVAPSLVADSFERWPDFHGLEQPQVCKDGL